jgi:predicted nucleic acid-binding protein
MKPTVYLETTIVSYLVGWLNRNSLSVAANQELTREWWARRRNQYQLFASTVVVDEARMGEGKLAAERLDFLREVELLEATLEARSLATELIRTAKIPSKAEIDALHIAIAAINGMTYLLSWNCAHIVNAATLPSVYEVCRRNGYEPPFVCTPQELMGTEDE